MDIEELIEQLNNLEACAYGYHINGEVLGIDCSDFEQIMVDAAEEISKIPTLQAELEQVKRERDAAVERLREWEKFDIYLLAHNFLIPEKWRGIQKED